MLRSRASRAMSHLFNAQPARLPLACPRACERPLRTRTFRAPLAWSRSRPGIQEAPGQGYSRSEARSSWRASRSPLLRCFSESAGRHALNEHDAPTILLNVTGMRCGGCSSKVSRVLGAHPDVAEAWVNLVTGTACVKGVPRASPDDLASTLCGDLARAGYPASARGTGGQDEQVADEKEARDGKESTRAALAAAFLGGASLALHGAHALGWSWAHSFVPGMVLSLAAFLGPGRGIVWSGLRSLLRGQPSMDSLVASGAAATLVSSIAAEAAPSLGVGRVSLEEPVMLLAAVLGGRAIEARARRRMRADCAAMERLVPRSALLVVESAARGEEKEQGQDASLSSSPRRATVSVPVGEVQPGDVVFVPGGSRVPVDGEAIRGLASVDLALLTGEDVPARVRPGSRVLAGSRCVEGSFLLRCALPGHQSLARRMSAAVAQAQARPAAAHALADRVGGVFCASVLALAGGAMAFWGLWGWEALPLLSSPIDIPLLSFLLSPADPAASPTAMALRVGASLLVVACPCALGLATPAAVAVAVSEAAGRGILVRGGDVLEKLARVDTVVFDKTGTLTTGRLQLESIWVPGEGVWRNRGEEGGGVGRRGKGEDEEDGFSSQLLLPFAHPPSPRALALLSLAAALEARAVHPIARAICEAARALGAADVEEGLGNVRNTPGSGVEATNALGETIFVGRQDWVSEKLLGCGLRDGAFDATSDANTQVWVGSDAGSVLGCISLSSALRPDARQTVDALRARGLQVHLFSGDAHLPTLASAGLAGIDPGNARGGMRPEAKAAAVAALRAAGRRVLMVGDGVNDSLALLAADAGASMRSGADLALRAAGVALPPSRLSAAADALRIAREGMRTVRQNLGWAVAYNVVALPVAAGALIPWTGLVLDPGAAAGAMAVSSLLVVGNALRLQLKLKRERRRAGGQDEEMGRVKVYQRRR